MSAVTLVQWLAGAVTTIYTIKDGADQFSAILEILEGEPKKAVQLAQSKNDGCPHILLISKNLASNEEWKKRWTTGTRFTYTETGSSTFWHPQDDFVPGNQPSAFIMEHQGKRTICSTRR